MCSRWRLIICLSFFPRKQTSLLLNDLLLRLMILSENKIGYDQKKLEKNTIGPASQMSEEKNGKLMLLPFLISSPKRLQDNL